MQDGRSRLLLDCHAMERAEIARTRRRFEHLFRDYGLPERIRSDKPLTPAQCATRSRWACLLGRIHEVFPLSCPDCGAQMRILAFLIGPFTVAGILRHLGIPASPPPLTPARRAGPRRRSSPRP